MQFRDMRHQVEADDDTLQQWLETARQRFYDNLSLLQLQVPELAQQLREHQFEHTILTCDSAGDGNLILHETLQMCWPPRLFRPAYQPKQERFALIAGQLLDDGAELIAALQQTEVAAILLYVESLDALCASLHCADWTPLFKRAQLLFQVGADISQFEADCELLLSHGIPVRPSAICESEPSEPASEYGWHFQQALALTHSCDPVLRPFTHKFKQQPEFVLLNELIESVTAASIPLQPVRTILLCGAHTGVIEALYQLAALERIIFVHDQSPFPDRSRFEARGVEIVDCIASISEIPQTLINCFHQLPPEVPWQLRIYQGEDSANARQIRMMVELELRYIVQPTLGLQRSLQTMFHATIKPQAFLTRRTQWPRIDGIKVPALVLGNGPSLTRTIEAIHQGEAKGYLLVSCGSTLTTLLNHNITPDLHLELELSAWHIKQQEESRLAETLLVAPIGFHHQQRAKFGRSASFILNGHSVDELLPGFPADTLRIDDAFPTVLNLAIPLLSELGAEEIWLAGVDFAFANLQEHHAKGSHYEQQNKERYAEQSGELIPVTGIQGRSLLTKREFQLAAFQAHHAIHKHKHVRIMQLSDGLNFGGEYQQRLKPQPKVKLAPIFLDCSEAQLGWRKLPVKLDPRTPFQQWLSAEKIPEPQSLLQVLQQPHYQARVQRMTHQPIPLWAEGLQRNLAALLLHLHTQQQLSDSRFKAFQQQLNSLMEALDPLVAKLSQ